MVPYLGQTSARNSSGVEALDTRWMEPAPTGNSACQDPGSPHNSCTRPHQDPSGPGSWLREREARRSRLSSHALAPTVLVLLLRTSREGFFGKISLSGSAPAQGIVDPRLQHGAVRIQGQVDASSPPLLQGAPVALAQGGQTLGGHSVLHTGGCCFPFRASFPLSVVSSRTPRFSPSVFHNRLPSHRIPADWAGFILFSLLFLHLLLMFLLRVTARGMRPQSPPPSPPPLPLLPACRSVFHGSQAGSCQAAFLEQEGWLPVKSGTQEPTFCISPCNIKVHFYPSLSF